MKGTTDLVAKVISLDLLKAQVQVQPLIQIFYMTVVVPADIKLASHTEDLTWTFLENGNPMSNILYLEYDVVKMLSVPYIFEP